jgi:hypothetical protein
MVIWLATGFAEPATPRFDDDPLVVTV